MPFLGDPFGKLTEDLGVTFRPQREWIERQGLLLISGHFLSGIGAGAWLLSLVFGFRPGLAISLVPVAAAGIAHLAYLGKRERFWRMLARPQSSWISRGFIGMVLLVFSGASYVAPTLMSGLPWTPESAYGRLMLLVSIIGVAGIISYKGFVYAVCKAIPFWHTPLLPALYIAYALRGGAAVLILVSAFSNGGLQIEQLELVETWAVMSVGVLMLLYLYHKSGLGGAASQSVRDLIAGRISLAFYVGIVALGMIVPLLIALLGYLTSFSGTLTVVLASSSLIGDFYLKYGIAKAGRYLPALAFPVSG